MSNTIEFQLYDWLEDHQIDDQETKNDYHKIGKYIIHAFGRTAEGKSVYAKITNYTPYFYIELPDDWVKLTSTQLNLRLEDFKNFLIGKYNKKIWDKFKNALIEISLVKAKKAEGFTNEKQFTFARLIFTNADAMKKFRSFFEDNTVEYNFKSYNFKTYEANLPPMFRCFHLRNIPGCSWVQTSNYIQKTKSSIKESHCDIEIEVEWKNISPTQKSFNAPLRIASFDIECYSHDGQFPQAHRKKDKIIQIGVTYTYLGESKPYRQYIACLKETDNFDDETDLRYFDNEKDLILDWKDEMIKSDCDIITGYNIFYFDEKYIFDRTHEDVLNIQDEMSYLSKLKKHRCNFKEMKLASSALGENLLRFWETPGRVHIDLMKDIQKTFNLPNYKLDFVASNFIRGQITNVDINDKNECNLTCATINDICNDDYIHIEVNKGVVSDEVGYKYLIKNIDTKNKILTIEIDDNVKQELEEIKKNPKLKLFWSQAKDDVGPKDIFRLQKGTSQDRSIVAKYCIKDCKLVNLLINKLQVVVKNIEMANVCYVPLTYLFIRGQGIKIFSLCLKEFKEQGYIFPVIKPNRVKICRACNIETKGWTCSSCKSRDLEELESNESFEGAIVFDPVPTVDYEAYVTKDYNSLYPSSLIQKNMSHETIVENDEFDNIPGIEYFGAQFIDQENNIQYRRFAKKDNKLGVVPLILDKLLKERKAVKNLMEEEQDPFKAKILDAKQLALKLTANSLYGQLGAGTSPVCKRDLAACTTSTGREMLIIGKKYDEEILPGLINGMKYALENNDDETFNKLLDLELKNRKGDYADKFISNLKKYLLNELKDKTIQPVVRYGDTDSNFSCYRIRENIQPVNFDESLKLWKEIIKFSKEFVLPFIPNEYHELWFHYHDTYYNPENINDLTLPDGPKVLPYPTHWKIILPIEERIKQYLKEYMEESYIPWLWTVQEIIMKEMPNMDYKYFQWGQHQMSKIRLVSNDYTDELINSYGSKVKEINTKIRKNILEMKKKECIIKEELEKTNEELTKEMEENKQIHTNLVNQRQVIIQKLSNFVNNILEDYWIQPCWKIKDNKKIHSFIFYKGGNSITDKRSLDYSLEIGKISGELILKRLPFPHKFAYEKTFWPFLILCKKKYVGNKYEMDINKYKQDFMGIVLKRRDNAPIVKEICGGIIDMLINKRDPIGAKNYLIKCLQDMFDGKYDIKYFLQSRNLKTKESYKDWTKIAHVFLSERIGERDQGNKPQSGDRIQFAVVKKQNDDPKKKLLQGELIETPEFIKQNNLEIDYLFYMTNQIQNPATQFLELVDKNIHMVFDDFKEKYGPKKPVKVKIEKPVKVKIEKPVKVKIEKPVKVKIEKPVKKTKKIKPTVIENVFNDTTVDIYNDLINIQNKEVNEEPNHEPKKEKKKKHKEEVIEEPIIEEPKKEKKKKNKEEVIEEPKKEKKKKHKEENIEEPIIEEVKKENKKKHKEEVIEEPIIEEPKKEKKKKHKEEVIEEPKKENKKKHKEEVIEEPKKENKKKHKEEVIEEPKKEKKKKHKDEVIEEPIIEEVKKEKKEKHKEEVIEEPIIEEPKKEKKKKHKDEIIEEPIIEEPKKEKKKKHKEENIEEPKKEKKKKHKEENIEEPKKENKKKNKEENIEEPKKENKKKNKEEVIEEPIIEEPKKEKKKKRIILEEDDKEPIE